MEVESHIYTPQTLISPHTSRPTTNAVKTTPPIFWCEVCHTKLVTPTVAIQHISGKSHTARKHKKDSGKKNVVVKRKHVLDDNNVKPDETVVQEPATKKSKKQTKNAVVQEPATKNTKKQTTNAVIQVPATKNTKKQTKDIVQEPATKKSKEKSVPSNQDLKCEDCNLTFTTGVIAVQHFKGKKHAKKIAAKITAKQNQAQRGGQKGGRGRGGKGRGRSDGFGRGRGLMRGVINKDGGFSKGHVAGELVRAMNNFYSKPLNVFGNLDNPSNVNDKIGGSSSNYYDNDYDYGTNNYSTPNDGYLATYNEGNQMNPGATYNTLCTEIKDSLCSEIYQLKRKLGEI